MRVLMLVQQIDERDWLRGFIAKWVRALAHEVEHLHVLTLEHHPTDLPGNVTVYSMGKEHGKNRARELLNFHRATSRVIGEVDVIFSHMTPRYTLVAAPYAALHSRRQVLWFTHRQPSTQLRAALACCWRIATAVPESFPLTSPKVRALGHGIDTDFFAPANTPPPTDQHYIVQVARLMPIKHQATLLRAIAPLPSAHAVLIGGVPTGQEAYADYAASLHQLVDELDIGDRVTFTGGLLPPDVRDWYRKATAAVNLSPPGLFDKAALESMATGAPTIVSNPAFDSLLGDDVSQLRIGSPGAVSELTEQLRAFISANNAERASVGAGLRQRVTEAHSLKRLMPRLVRLFETGEPE